MRGIQPAILAWRCDVFTHIIAIPSTVCIIVDTISRRRDIDVVEASQGPASGGTSRMEGRCRMLRGTPTPGVEEGVSLNPISRITRHHARIDIYNSRDVMYWTGLWGLTDQELRDAVAAVGPEPGDVAAHIGQPLFR
jgi:hypothetical protein